MDTMLDDPSNIHRRVFNEITLLLRRRANYPVFHPDAPQEIMETDEGVFGLKRTSVSGGQHIICISNFTAKNKTVRTMKELLGESSSTKIKDIISDKNKSIFKGCMRLKPFQTVWLVLT